MHEVTIFLVLHLSRKITNVMAYQYCWEKNPSLYILAQCMLDIALLRACHMWAWLPQELCMTNFRVMAPFFKRCTTSHCQPLYQLEFVWFVTQKSVSIVIGKIKEPK
jgi:hypothetical protein